MHMAVQRGTTAAFSALGGGPQAKATASAKAGPSGSARDGEPALLVTTSPARTLESSSQIVIAGPRRVRAMPSRQKKSESREERGSGKS